jgi:hypothetical protein
MSAVISAMARGLLGAAALLGAGCGAKPGADSAGAEVDGAEDGASGGADGAGDGADGAGDGADGADGGAPVDADGDGVPAPEDCDDQDRLSYPEAAEAYNGVDDDCDGRIDADGDYVGALALSGSAEIEGVVEPWALGCPATLSRGGGAMRLEVRCTPPVDDDYLQLILGAELLVVAEAPTVSGDRWAGRGELRSSAGWDTWADVTVQFSGFSDPAVTVARDTVSLSLRGEGALGLPGR